MVWIEFNTNTKENKWNFCKPTYWVIMQMQLEFSVTETIIENVDQGVKANFKM